MKTKPTVSLTEIKSLNPCQNRLDNYIKFYGERKFTHAQFMGLKSITQEDKMWVAFRLMSKMNIVLAAADIAESTLHLFESKYPNDNRPRLAIEAARVCAKNPTDKNKEAAYSAADSAVYSARSAADSAVYSARSAAYSAVYSAVYSADSAAYSAVYSADSAAYSAVYSARSAAYSAQEKLIRKIVLKYWK